MNNLICIFFGHKDDELLLRPPNEITVVVNNIQYAKYKRCKRCTQIFLQSTIDNDGDTL